MISSKHILKDPEAFKLSLSPFIAPTTPSVPGKAAGVHTAGASYLIPTRRGTWDEGRRAVKKRNGTLTG